MKTDEATELVRRILHGIAPEIDLGAVDEDADLREALDLDSIDFLNFAAGVSQATGIEIPERDYPLVATLRGCIDYLARAAA